jgi:hypothetical protein
MDQRTSLSPSPQPPNHPPLPEHTTNHKPTHKSPQALPTQTLPDRRRYLLTLLDHLLGESPDRCPEATGALAPAGLSFSPSSQGGAGEGEVEGTGLDRVVFLACALALWVQMALLGGGAAGGKGFAAEVGCLVGWVGGREGVCVRGVCR